MGYASWCFLSGGLCCYASVDLLSSSSDPLSSVSDLPGAEKLGRNGALKTRARIRVMIARLAGIFLELR